VEAAVYGEQAVEEDCARLCLTLVGDVGANYAEARGYQAQIALAQRTLVSQRRTADLTRVKFEAGPLRAPTPPKRTRKRRTPPPTFQPIGPTTPRRSIVSRLLTGRAPGALYDRMLVPRAIPVTRKPLPAGVPADLLSRRPDVRAAERRVAQATAKIGAAEAALYPDVSLTGSLSTAASRPGELLRASSVSWSWGPSRVDPDSRWRQARR